MLFPTAEEGKKFYSDSQNMVILVTCEQHFAGGGSICHVRQPDFETQTCWVQSDWSYTAVEGKRDMLWDMQSAFVTEQNTTIDRIPRNERKKSEKRNCTKL